MKKSNKKIKSDRINALRKQYDTFLEEDKRRRERNDMILNKLDKMRYCNPTIPLRTTPSFYMSQQTGFYNKGNSLKKSSTYDKDLLCPKQEMPLKLSKKHLDDTFMLQEIAKKYILIPKRSFTYVNEYPEAIKPEVESDLDWKSKYNILNQLKQNDNNSEYKGKINSNQENKHLKNYDSVLNIPNYDPVVNNDLSEIPVTQQHVLGKNMDETPEKDIIDTKPYMSFENTESSKQNINDVPFILIENQGDINETQNLLPKVTNDLEYKADILRVSQEVVKPIQDSYSGEGVEQKIVSNVVTPISNSLKYLQIQSNDDGVGNEQPQQAEIIDFQAQNYTQEYLTAKEESVIVTNHPNLNYEPTKPEISFKETIDDNNVTEELKEAENIVCPIEIINVEEFTPDDNVDLQDGVNINPNFDRENSSIPQQAQNEISVEDVENHIDVSGIEAFDAEQREMFYSEETNEHNAYDQTNPENVDQEYTQNENYQQNEAYSFYEESQQNQAYLPEANDFEETSQPYDQTYQEQYAEFDPQYVQPETYEQQPQQYEGIQEMDPNIQPEMEQLQYEQLNYEPQNIEQQLDTEQGYTENEELENANIQRSGNIETEEPKHITDQSLENSEIQ